MADAGDRTARAADLSPAKRALLEQRLRGRATGPAPKLTIPRRDPASPAPLSFAQERLWYLDQLEPEAPIYSVRTAYRLAGALDVAALRRALTALVARHEALRTRFEVRGELPVQVVAPPAETPLPIEDLSGLDPAARRAALAALLDREAVVPFDLARGPLLRLLLARLDEREHVLLLVAHHTVIDGWSLGVLKRELVALYQAVRRGTEASLPAPRIQYGDYAAWQRGWLSGERLERLLAYWQGALGGELTPLEMPTDRPRPAVQRYRGTAQTFEIPAPLVERLAALGREEGATLFMVLLAATASAIARHARQPEVVFGSPVANRERPELESLVGLLVNVLVLRVPVEESASFRQLLRRTRDACLGAYVHQELPFERLVQELRPERDLSRTPLFQTLFAFLDTSGDPTTMDGVSLSELPWHPPVARTDLAFWLETAGGPVTGALEYSTDLFDAGTIERFLRRFRNLLEGIAAQPDAALHDLPLLDAEERRRILVDWNATDAELTLQPVHEAVRAQAARTPDRVAVRCSARELTYAELEISAARLAAHLGTLGVGRHDRVGILLDRSPEMLVAMLGILRAGAAYVPLDPEYPEERLAFMARDAELAAVVTQTDLVARVPADAAGCVVYLDRDGDAVRAAGAVQGPGPAGLDDPAYVIYTSGSTGAPKGVVVLHRGVANFLAAMRREPGLGEGDVLLAVTTLSFDIAVLELFLPLTVGACTLIAARDAAADGARLRALLESSGATVMQATPATWRLLLAAGWRGTAGFVVLCGGEALEPELASELGARAGAVWNMYGPTETTVWSTCQRVDGDGPILIGRPIANTTVYVLDDAMHPVPVGVPGELYIGGAGVAGGYWKRPELTAERFLPDRFSDMPGARLYRTGDWVRFCPDGRLEYLRRLDNQVKVRGFRIELGEIESALRGHDSVREAVAAVRSYGAGDARLVAYVVPAGADEPTGTELRAYLRDRLPAYMVPSLFVTLGQIPRTPNGKVDRRALPDPVARAAVVHAPPTTPMERAIAAIWCEVLGVDHVGVNDNFFDLGGHSLLSMQVIARVERAVGVRLGAREFVLQTLGQIAAHCAAQVAARGPDERVGEKGAVTPRSLARRLLGLVTGRGVGS